VRNYFDIGDLSLDRLMADWRWLCAFPVSLVAVDAWGTLFLLDESGCVFRLDVSIGQLSPIASSLREFLEESHNPEKRNEWFGSKDEELAKARGFEPSRQQCLAFKIPIVFAESRGVKDNLYVADLVEYVSFLGHLHQQLADVPDQSRVRLEIVD
jgi:hypothetical protein